VRLAEIVSREAPIDQVVEGTHKSAEEEKLFIATLPKQEDDECNYSDRNDNAGPHTRLKNVPDDPTAGHYRQQRGEICDS
jgi:hypothetical protein